MIVLILSILTIVIGILLFIWNSSSRKSHFNNQNQKNLLNDQIQKAKLNNDANEKTKNANIDTNKQHLDSDSQPSQVIQKDQNQKSTIDTSQNTKNAFEFFKNKAIQQLESNPQQPKEIQIDQNQKSKSDINTNENTKNAFAFFKNKTIQQPHSNPQQPKVIQIDQNQKLKSDINTNENTKNAFEFFKNKTIQQLESNPQQPKVIQTDQNQKSKSDINTNENTKNAFEFFKNKIIQQPHSNPQQPKVIQIDQNQKLKSDINTNENTKNAFEFVKNKTIQQPQSNPQQPKVIQSDQNQKSKSDINTNENTKSAFAFFRNRTIQQSDSDSQQILTTQNDEIRHKRTKSVKILSYVNSINEKISVSQAYKEEIQYSLYDPNLFSHLFAKKAKCTEEEFLQLPKNLIFEFQKNCMTIEINETKFIKDTLIPILAGNEEPIKIRTFLLILMLNKNINFTKSIEFIIRNEKNLLNQQFYNQLKTNNVLLLNLIESLKIIIKNKSIQLNQLFPIMNDIVLTNEDSLNPISSNKILFFHEYNLNDDNLYGELFKNCPLLIPFSIKFDAYTRSISLSDKIPISANRDDILASVFKISEIVNEKKNPNIDINVNFDNESGIDCGGPRREYLKLAFNKIVEKETGLFECRNGSYWFKYQEKMTESLRNKYRCIGTLLGITVRNGYTIPFHFPTYFYKKLMKREINYKDLVTFDPSLFNSINNSNDDQLSEIDFTYVDSISGYVIDLNDFTNTNLKDSNYEPEKIKDKIKYLEKVSDWVFNISVNESFKAFEDGFNEINTNSKILFRIFQISELDRIFSGDLKKDWIVLKKNAIYNECSPESNNVKLFWKYFDSLSDDEKLEKIGFITGSNTIPPGGIKNITIQFSRYRYGSYPVFHTCFGLIDLPDFVSYDDLVDKFEEAFANEFFGMA